MATYEMLWDCVNCGAQKNLGLTHRHCPNCGSPQDPQKRYYPADSEKQPVENHAYVGSDLVCAYCQTAASRVAKCCPGCGAPLEEGVAVAQREQQKSRDAFAAETGEDAERAHAQAAMGSAPVAPPKKSSRTFKLAAFGCAGLLVLACVGGAVAMFWKKEGALTVASHQWTREVQIERFGPVNESAWCDALPTGARVQRRAREEHHTNRVQDGQECHNVRTDNGDGTYSEHQECSPRYREEPVLADKCYYQIDKWTASRTATAQGGLADAPAWPAVQLAGTGQCVGCEREGTRTEHYVVTFSEAESGEAQTCDLDQARWATFAPGSSWKGEIRIIGGGLDCDTLAPR